MQYSYIVESIKTEVPQLTDYFKNGIINIDKTKIKSEIGKIWSFTSWG